MSDDTSPPEPRPERLTGAHILASSGALTPLLERAASAGIDLSAAWLVGGVVRDALRGQFSGTDIDLAIEGDGVAFAHVFAAAVGGDVIAEHRFGTATVVVDVGDPWGIVHVDVASCRTESYTEPGALPQVRIGASIEQDMARRDFTVNAIAVALTATDQHAIVDPFHGQRDLHVRTLRTLHPDSFVDDPTRIFRAARYSGRLGFRVGEHTREQAVGAVDAGALATLSADRVRTELDLQLSEQAFDGLTLLSSWGVLHRLEPRLERMFHAPVLMRVIDEACSVDPVMNRRARLLRLAELARHLGDDAAAWLRWMGYDTRDSGAVLEHVRVVNTVLDDGPQLAELANSELYLRLGEVDDESMALAALAADAAGLEQLIPVLVRYVLALRNTRLSVRGDDIIAMGIARGRAVGEILGSLFLRALDGEFADEQAEREAARALVDARDDTDRGDHAG